MMNLRMIAILFICFMHPSISQAGFEEKDECIQRINFGCTDTFNDAAYQYCCQWFNGELQDSPESMNTYMKRIKDTLIADVVFVVLDVLVMCCVGIGLYMGWNANWDKEDPEDLMQVGKYAMIGLAVHSLIFTIVRSITAFNIAGIISKNDLVEIFEDLETANCYTSDMQWFATKLTDINGLAISIGVFKIVAMCLVIAFRYWVNSFIESASNPSVKVGSSLKSTINKNLKSLNNMGKSPNDLKSDIYMRLQCVKCCDCLLFALSIGLWAVGFMVVGSWNDVYETGLYAQCYTGGTMSVIQTPTFASQAPTVVSRSPFIEITIAPSLSPTPSPSSSPTPFPVIEPTRFPIIEPTMNPTVESMSPSEAPTVEPTSETMSPSQSPTMEPTVMKDDNDNKSGSAWKEFVDFLGDNWEVTLVVCVVIFVLICVGFGVGCCCGNRRKGYEKVVTKQKEEKKEQEGENEKQSLKTKDLDEQ